LPYPQETCRQQHGALLQANANGLRGMPRTGNSQKQRPLSGRKPRPREFALDANATYGVDRMSR